MTRQKQALINTIIGFVSKFIILVLGFVVPRIMLTNYGSDTNGLTGTISQIFTYVALLEAGIGQATQNALYPYLRKHDNANVSRIMSVSRRYYRRISIVYAIAVVGVSFLLPFVLKTQIDYWTVFFYTFFQGLTSLVSFYFTALWNIFLNASGKTYFTNLVTLLQCILQYGVKIVLALFCINIVFIQVGYFAVSLVALGVYAIYMKKHYSWIDYGVLSKGDRLPDRWAYVLTEIAGVVFSGTDLIVLSTFVSTSLASVYSVYNMVYVALNSLLGGVYFSVSYLIGDTYWKDLEEYKKLHNVFNSVFIGAMTMLLCVAYWLIIPFVKLYTKGVTDIDYIYLWLPLCFSLVQLLSWTRYVSGALSGVAGYAKPVSYISLAEAVTNVVASIVLVNFMGIYGVILATVVALPIKVIYLIYLSERKIMKRKPWRTLAIIGINYLIFGVTVLLEYFFSLTIESYEIFIIYGIVLVLGYTVVVGGLNIAADPDLIRFPKLLKNAKKQKTPEISMTKQEDEAKKDDKQ